MDNFKQSTREKVRFNSTKGELTTEQLWDLSIDNLNDLAVALDAEYNQSGKKSFIRKTSVKDKKTKLKFDVVLEILNTKMAESEAIIEAKEIKEHNDKIHELIAKKKDGELEGKSVKELKAMLKN